MRTIDVRLLVRGSHDVDDVLEQLLTGALRVHASVQLVTTASGLTVPVAPIHRATRSANTFAVVRSWDGTVLSTPVDHPARGVADLTQLVPPSREPS